MGYATKRYLLYTGIATALSILGTVSGAPNMNMDPTSILFPDKYDEMRREYALQQCQDNPRCKTGLFFAGIPDACNALRDTITRPHTVGVRTSGEKCNPFAGEVVWPATGQCVQLLTQGPCPDGYWIKLQLSDSRPNCEPRPCQKDQAWINGIGCISLNTTGVCESGQSLVNNENGIGQCDCQLGKAYYYPRKACYRVYSQGPCERGQIFKVLDELGGSTAQCEPNPCPQEKLVKLNSKCQVDSNGMCYNLGSKGPCVNGVLAIDPILLEPTCILETETHSIISGGFQNECPIGESRNEAGLCRVPFRISNTRKCHRGSIRDQAGKCRGYFSLTSGDGGDSSCANKMIKVGGACYKLAG